MPTPDADQNPLAALSLLSLAASHQPRPAFANPQHSLITSSFPQNSSISSPITTSPSGHGPSSLTAFSSMSTPPINARSPSVSRPSAGIAQKHRRMSSTGQRGRRLSEATAATAAAFVRGASVSSTSGISAAQPSSPPTTLGADSIHKHLSGDPFDQDEVETATSANGKKKVIYRCETCSKAYRHPNCLLKHRWEHSPHWREASKFLLSKHQQVQLLEAAAILSHIAPSDSVDLTGSIARGTSLPEDRSLWPSYLSGGLLPVPSGVQGSGGNSNKVSNLTVAKDTGIKPEESSSGEDEEPRDRDSGYGSGGVSGISSSSLPPSSSMPIDTPSTGARHQRGSDKSASPNPASIGNNGPASGTFSASASLNTSAFRYGSVGNMPSGFPDLPTSNNALEIGAKQSDFVPSQSVGHRPFAGTGAFSGTRTMPYPTSSSAAGRSRSRSISSRHSAPFSAIQPPPHHRNRPSQHKHTRASSSISSSYTRSSIRGDGDDEEDNDDDDGFNLDFDDPYTGTRTNGPFGAPGAAGSSYSRSAFSGSVPSSFSASHQAYQAPGQNGYGQRGSSADTSGEIGTLMERDGEDDGDDTVDEESIEGDGAGMEIDTMEL